MITEPLVQLDRVSLTLDTADHPRTILHPVDLQIQTGEWIALVGSNGSGKSTLAKIIAGLQSPSSGTVTLTSVEQPAIQLVFQNPDTSIIGETVYEDICFGMGNFGVAVDDMQAIASEALGKVGLGTHIHSATSTLSGGQKQLLAIAGCLVVNPSVYVFDEATSMLDPMSRQLILKVVRQLHSEGKTIIWITQLLDELAICDRVVGMMDGKLMFDGSKSDFFYKKGTDTLSPCERLGFRPPYTVLVAEELAKHGYILEPPPLTPEQLSKAVSEL